MAHEEESTLSFEYPDIFVVCLDDYSVAYLTGLGILFLNLRIFLRARAASVRAVMEWSITDLRDDWRVSRGIVDCMNVYLND